MDREPLVSIGIPCYNRPEGLRRTLECITGQTYKNLEIIVSDNCSPYPDVEKVGREFEVKDLRVQYHRQSVNIGPLPNFQFLVQQATGKYFMWAADDDLLDENYIELLMEIHSKKEYSLVGANWNLESPSGIINNLIELPGGFWGEINPNYSSLKLFLTTPHFKTSKQSLIYGIYNRDKLLEYFISKKQGFFPDIIDIGSDLIIIYAMICNGPVYALNKKIWIHHIDYEFTELTLYGKLRKILAIFRNVLFKKKKHHHEIDMYIREINDLSEKCIDGSLERIMLYFYITLYKLKLKYWYYL